MKTQGEVRHLEGKREALEINLVNINTLTPDLWPLGAVIKTNFCCLSHRICGPLLQQP